MEPLELSCVILAGGQSRRMGQDKALLSFGQSSTLAEFQYRRLLPLFRRLYLSAKADKFPFQAPLILDRYELSSPLLALLSIFESIEDNAVFIIAVDTPFVSHQSIIKMYEAFHAVHVDALWAQTGTTLHPLCGIYHRSIVPTLKRMLQANRLRLQSLFDIAHIKTLPLPEAQLRNLNTPQAYQEALKSLP